MIYKGNKSDLVLVKINLLQSLILLFTWISLLLLLLLLFIGILLLFTLVRVNEEY